MTYKLNAMEQVVLGAILSFPNGATQDDIAKVITPRYPNANFTARFADLKRKGIIAATGEFRPGSLGRKQSVLKVTDKATAFPQ